MQLVAWVLIDVACEYFLNTVIAWVLSDSPSYCCYLHGFEAILLASALVDTLVGALVGACRPS